MAFYSVRVDDEGKEIETTRQTFRKLYLDSLENASVRGTCRDNPQGATPVNNYKTVRYVNSATFIEKDLKAAKKLTLSEEEDDNENEDAEGANSDRSGYNSDDMNDHQYQTHIATDCDTVPLLELNSNESFPSSNNMTYSYRRVCEVTKMIQKPDAYKEWLDAKKTAKLYERKLKLEKEKDEEERKKQRNLLAEKKFQEWVAKKSKAKIEREKQKMQMQGAETTEKQYLPEQHKTDSEEERREKEKNFKAWLRKKMQEEKSLKERLNEELKRERELEQKRRQQASAIYEGWLKTAPQKPKPVPLNKGMLTLKGSVSQIYINPVPWEPLDKTESSTSL